MKVLPYTLIAALAFAVHGSAQDPAAPVSTAPQASYQGPVIIAEYSNPQLSPAHWVLTLRPDGSGHFRSETGSMQNSSGKIYTPKIDRDVQLSVPFANSVFSAAQHHSFFKLDCESHMKVAYQGDKTLSYSGPEGNGSCTFNYSKDRDIQALGDNIGAVAQTIIEGVRLETLLQHDPLGLDKEMENLAEAAKSGRAQQLCVIRSILERLAQDDHVLDLVRKRARTLLAGAET